MHEHIYNSWSAFASFIDNSNWGAALLALVIPTIPLGVYGEWQHRKTRRHTESHHSALHDRLDKLFDRDNDEEKAP